MDDSKLECTIGVLCHRCDTREAQGLRVCGGWGLGVRGLGFRVVGFRDKGCRDVGL